MMNAIKNTVILAIINANEQTLQLFSVPSLSHSNPLG